MRHAKQGGMGFSVKPTLSNAYWTAGYIKPDDGGQRHCLVTQTESVKDPTSFLSCVVLLRVVRYSTFEGPTAVSKKNAGRRRRRDFRKNFQGSNS